MLQLEAVSLAVGGETHIDRVDLALDRGTLNVLLGPTLSGKTSLMRLMAGLDRPTGGRILMDGKDVTGVPVRRRNVAMVYQQFINYPSMSVYENIASPLRVAGRPRAEIEEKVQGAARLLKLEPYLKRTPLELSGGQQQRTALARALVKGAELVLLDEPLANLDYKLREELREELPKIFAEANAVVVYATTEPTEALLLGGRTATLREGRVTQVGATPDVYRRPADLVTAQTFSDPPLNVFAMRCRGGELASDLGVRVPARGLADGDYQIGVRPHHIGPHGEGSVAVETRTVVAEVTGSQTFLHADLGATRVVSLMNGIHRFEPGQKVTLHFDPANMLVFSADGQRVAPAPAQAA